MSGYNSGKLDRSQAEINCRVSIVLWHHTWDNPNAVLRTDLKSFTFKVIFTETKQNCAAAANQKHFDYSSVHQNSFHFTSRLPLD